jgi:ATP-dependent DNA ligase
MSSIPLAKGFDEKKLSYPVYCSIKYDGVPVRIDVSTRGQSVESLTVRSRQDKPVPSVTLQAELLARRAALLYPSGDYTFVAETTHKVYTDFKDVSGVVRRHEQSTDLILNIFDFATPALDLPFGTRKELLWIKASGLESKTIKVVEQIPAHDTAHLATVLHTLEQGNPAAEGFVVRSHDAMFKPGARHWDYQKVVKDPTMDLKVVGFEYAVDKHGNTMDMIGRINCWYKGQIIGVGPGKLTHAERRELAKAPMVLTGYNRIAKVQYKKDDSYEALRQPTFQCWRDDKDEVSYE